MRTILISTILIVVFALTGCRAKKEAVKENFNLSLIDTTKRELNSTTSKILHSDTTKTAAGFTVNGAIEFIEDGGTINIDTAGNITLQGVKAISGAQTGRILQLQGSSKEKDTKQTQIQQANGIKKEESETKETQSEVSSSKWYNKPFTWIGYLCCIAALLWAIFLYLKRKF